jgi:hypothetical protein
MFFDLVHVTCCTQTLSLVLFQQLIQWKGAGVMQAGRGVGEIILPILISDVQRRRCFLWCEQASEVCSRTFRSYHDCKREAGDAQTASAKSVCERQ